MKQILIILLLTAFFASCSDDDEKEDDGYKIRNEWLVGQWITEGRQGERNAQIYVFRADKTYSIYKINSTNSTKVTLVEEGVYNVVAYDKLYCKLTNGSERYSKFEMNTKDRFLFGTAYHERDNTVYEVVE